MVPQKCVCLVTTPGTWNDKKSDALLQEFITFLGKQGISGKFVDCVPGWGCQSQDWFQFQAETFPSYGWLVLAGISEEKWQPWQTHLKEGHLLFYMQVFHGDQLVPYQ